MEFFGQGQQALGQQRQLGDAHRQLAHLGAEHLALAADHITDVQLFEGRVGFVPQQIPFHENLNIALLVPQMGKAGLAHHPLGHHAARQRDHLAGLRLGGQFGKFRLQVGGVGVLRVFGDGEGIPSGVFQIGQFLAAHGGLLAEFLLGLGLVLLHFYRPFVIWITWNG